MRIGLWGYGQAGRAVASVLSQEPGFQLRWVIRGSMKNDAGALSEVGVPIHSAQTLDIEPFLQANPVDAIVDFSVPDAIYLYGPSAAKRRLRIVSAISNYSAAHREFIQELGRRTPVMASANITLGINFLLIAAGLLRKVAPFADVEIIEQHFREKPDISGTAKRMAQSLELAEERITSLRLGGIVGHHEVVFGFPHQTVRLVHDAIRREAFGTGAAFALRELSRCRPGTYTFDDLLQRRIREALIQHPVKRSPTEEDFED